MTWTSEPLLTPNPESDIFEDATCLHPLFEHSPLGIFVLDAAGVILQANPRARQILQAENLQGSLL